MSFLFEYLFLLISMQVLVHAAHFNEQELNIQKWNSFKTRFNKKYESVEEDQFRMKIYLNNAEEIAKHNERFKKGAESYEKEISKFSDLTTQEFARIYLIPINPGSIPNTHVVTSLPPSSMNPPESKNWVAEGVVTPVKHQGYCGSCWAFTAVAAIESHYLIKNRNYIVDLSEQNLVDCVGYRGTVPNNCCGGFSRFAFDYVKNSRGIATEKSYQYIDQFNMCPPAPQKNENVTTDTYIGRSHPFQNLEKVKIHACQRGAWNMEKVRIENYAWFNNISENYLKQIVGLVGPVTSAIDASGLQHYKRGTIWKSTCCYNMMGTANHEVLVVGYGTDAGQDYWLVKNSWGADWGDAGYFRISRNVDNTCGIANLNSYPIV